MSREFMFALRSIFSYRKHRMPHPIPRCLVILMTVACLASRVYCVEDDFVPNAASVKSWSFDEKKASLMLCVTQAPSEYGYRIAVAPKHKGMTLTVTNEDGLKIVTEEVHEHTTFTIFEKKLVFAEYSDVGTGCTIVAVDLTEGKEVWRTRLTGVDVGSASAYSNLVVLGTRGKYLSVYGNESMGKYIEIVDMQNGKELSTKVFP